MRQPRIVITTLVLLAWLLAACRNEDPTITPEATVAETAVSQQPDEPTETPTLTAVPTATTTPTATPSPTATPVPPKELTVCMAVEPTNLYLYGDPFLSATAIRHAIYENLYTTLSYDYQPQGLETLPTLENGGVVLKEIQAVAGDTVFNAEGTVVSLTRGITVTNSSGEMVRFDGETPISMTQLEVLFSLHPMIWSDGTPVTAADSVFSFQVAADPATRVNKTKIERTASYEIVDDFAVRWTGIPGFIDSDYLSNVWQPLPSHQLAAFTAAELLTAPESSLSPLSSGPYTVLEWVAGDHITLVKNPFYYRAAEGFPHIDILHVRFGYDSTTALTAVLSGECDVATQDTLALDNIPTIDEAAQAGNLVGFILPTNAFEHIDFGIDSQGRYGDAFGRPDWFQDARVRQAIVMCTDRQRMVGELLYGRSAVMSAYLPTDHPLYPTDATLWPYDPAAANALLEEIGYTDTDGDGIREDTILSFRPFTITLSMDNISPLRQQIAQVLKENLRDCGIGLNYQFYSADEWYLDGPLGPLFGRRFDLAAFAWLIGVQPACELYTSHNITGPEAEGFGGWGNVNATAWVNSEFDAACKTAVSALPGTPAYIENHQQAIRVFADRVPIIPLFPNLKLAATAPNVQNFEPNVSQLSEWWNVAEWDVPQP